MGVVNAGRRSPLRRRPALAANDARRRHSLAHLSDISARFLRLRGSLLTSSRNVVVVAPALDSARQVMHRHVQSPGNSRQCFDGDMVIRSLDIPDVISRKISLFSELLLGEVCLNPLNADISTQNLRDATGRRHHPIAEQIERMLPTKYTCHYSLASRSGIRSLWRVIIPLGRHKK